jgi:hypothetical protein
MAAIALGSGGQGPIPVTLEQTQDGFRLLRAGKPYEIKGVGGNHSLEALAKAGGNSVRTWNYRNAGPILDEAHRLGLTVTVGIWLGHKHQGFSYEDDKAVAEQLERAKEAIRSYRNHPALLMWGIGNEMEGFEDGADPKVWAAVEAIAKAAKELDPNHPTMTVTAEIGGNRVPSVKDLCPSIDIHGINSYGGATSIADRYKAAGGKKPYVVTEFGPLGQWEVAKTPWGAPLEQPSGEKARRYREAYLVNHNSPMCLGSYAFLWGNKQEATSTWFGMWLKDGTRTAAVDAMQEVWSGKPPANRVPVIENAALLTPSPLKPGQEIHVRITATDPENDPLTAEWYIQAEQTKRGIGGETEPIPTIYNEALVEGDLQGAKFRLPSDLGGHRIFVIVRDNKGGGATVNIPILVE